MKKIRRPATEEPGLQFAVLPWRRAERLEIMLVSSRETGRWVLPKGWPKKGIKPHQTAAREALEEAGILGRVAKTPLGVFLCKAAGRWLSTDLPGAGLRLRSRKRTQFLAREARANSKFAVADAAEAVKEPELREAILKFEMVAMAEPKTRKSQNRNLANELGANLDYRDKFIVKPGQRLRLNKIDPSYKGHHETADAAAADTERYRPKLNHLQSLLYAEKRRSVLILLQALDAGKFWIGSRSVGFVGYCRISPDLAILVLGTLKLSSCPS